jgi:hypothetical protein
MSVNYTYIYKIVMNYLNFFKKNKPNLKEVITLDKPRPEQIKFANTVLEIFNPTLESYGFIRTEIKVTEYSTKIIFRKEKQYIKIEGTTYPTDYPHWYDILLGEDITSKELNIWDWVTLYQLKNKIECNNLSSEYNFPFKGEEESNIINAKNELTKYARSFLNGDMVLFYQTRSRLNKERGPFKITIIYNYPKK